MRRPRCGITGLVAVGLAASIGCGASLAPAPVRAGERLDQIVVTGTRTERFIDDAPVRTEVVGAEEIARTGARTLDEALENVAGLKIDDVHGKSGRSVSLQGFDAERVLVLIDGLPISASTGSAVDLSQYLVGDIERIEIVKGAASALYGSAAMGGVVNVITRVPRPGFAARGEVDLATRGPQNPDDADAGIGRGHLTASVRGGSPLLRWRLSAEALEDEGYAPDPSGWDLPGDRISRRQATGRAVWAPRDATQVDVEVGRYTERVEQRFSAFVPPVSVPQRKTEDIARDRITARARHRFDNGLTARLDLLDEVYDTDSLTRSNGVVTIARTAESGLQHAGGQFDLPMLGDHAPMLGFDLRRETLAQTNNGIDELRDGTEERTAVELFAQDDWFQNDRTEWVVGLRAQRDSGFGFHAAPKLSVRRVLWDEATQGSLRISIGHGYRVPNLKERYFVFDHSALGYTVAGNPDLGPESSNSLQVGFQVDAGVTSGFEVNAFYNDVDDLIQTDSLGVAVGGIERFGYRNVASARTAGLETRLEWPLGARAVFRGGYTLTLTRDRATGLELTRQPRHSLRLGLDVDLGASTSLAVRARFQSDELVSTETLARSPRWTTLDLSLTHTVSSRIELFAAARNVFGEQQDFADPNDFRPSEGRRLMVGLRARTDGW